MKFLASWNFCSLSLSLSEPSHFADFRIDKMYLMYICMASSALVRGANVCGSRMCVDKLAT